MGFIVESPSRLFHSLGESLTREEQRERSNPDQWLNEKEGIIDCLDPEKVWVLYEAVQRLGGQWVRREGPEAIDTLRELLQNRINNLFSRKQGRAALEAAKKRWAAWHSGFLVGAAAEGTVDRTEGFEYEDTSNEDEYGQTPESESEHDEETTKMDGHVDDTIDSQTNAESRWRNVSSNETRPGPSPQGPNSLQVGPNTPQRRPPKDKSASASKVFQQSDRRSGRANAKERSCSAPQISRHRNAIPLGQHSPDPSPIKHLPAQLDQPSAQVCRGLSGAPQDSHRRRTDSKIGSIGSLGSPSESAKLLEADYDNQAQALEQGWSASYEVPAISVAQHVESADSTVNEAEIIASLDEGSSVTAAIPAEDPSSSIAAGRVNVNGRSPPFNRYHQDIMPVSQLTHNVFDLMREPLEQNKSKKCSSKKKTMGNQDEGYIYILYIEGYEGYVKIGRTEKKIEKRQKQINKCIKYPLKIIKGEDFCAVPNHKRVERLIHEELRNDRRKFPCDCGRTARKKNDCEESDGLTMHGEWFQLGQARACEVVGRWRKWMSSGPYVEGHLRPLEQLRIDYYDKNPQLKRKMKTVGNEWRWNDFMNFPGWKFRYLWIYNELHKSRPERSNCSRWESLRKYWKSNVVLCLVFVLLSCFFFVAKDCLPLAPISVFVSLHSIVFCGLTILYAA